MTEHIMTVQELYDFAKKHGFENAQIWFPCGTNVQSTASYAALTVFSKDNTVQRVELRV